jgi:hypothetical protein
VARIRVTIFGCNAEWLGHVEHFRIPCRTVRSRWANGSDHVEGDFLYGRIQIQGEEGQDS